jgi:hypothetical protein
MVRGGGWPGATTARHHVETSYANTVSRLNSRAIHFHVTLITEIYLQIVYLLFLSLPGAAETGPAGLAGPLPQEDEEFLLEVL